MNRWQPLIFPIIAVVICFVGTADAQNWTGIINPTRAINWQRANVGVSGGIPSGSWTQCGSTIAAYGSSSTPASPATINSALAACGSNQYVLLGSGTFWLSGAITPSTTSTPRSNLVLRGSGPNSTIVEVESGVSCGNGRATLICVVNGNGYYGAGGDSSAVTPPCGGSNASNCFNVKNSALAQGTTSVTISNVGSAGISNGDEIILDMGNDVTDTGGYFICDTYTSTICHQDDEAGSGNGRVISGLEFSQQQYVTVASGCSTKCVGSGPFTITLNQPIYANNWDGHTAIGGWFVNPVQEVGIENLTIDAQNAAAGGYNISFYNCRQCWVKNVRSLNSGRSHVEVFQSARVEIRDSYFYSTKSGASQSYGVEMGEGAGSDALIENNIFQQVAGPVVFGGATGAVIGYNFSISNDYSPTSYLQFSSSSHDTADSFNLFEGNILNGLSCDDIHGTADTMTYFRNWLNGRDWNAGAQPTQQTYPIELNSYCRGFNIIGNVLGTPGYHTNYQYVAGQTPTAVQCNVVIYELGFGGGICDFLSAAGVPDDSLVPNSLMRWGNYDTVNATVRWNSTEASPGAVKYIAAQSSPADQTLPPSFYLSGTPSWWGSMPFPPIGPDVTAGNGGTYPSGTYAQGICPVGNVAGGATCSSSLGGFASTNPAMNCYFNVMNGSPNGTGGALSFDANSCYGSARPPAPQNLQAAVH